MIANRKTKAKRELIVPIASAIAILFFFVIAILGLNLSGEDILHKTTMGEISLAESVSKTFYYLPRIGEFYQKITIRFFSYQTSFGLDLFFRVIDVALCILAIYITTALILGKKPKLNYRDNAITLFVFLALVCFNSREIFTMRFSYIHNYVPIIILVSSVLYIIVRQKQSTKKTYVGNLLVAFLCGFCNEIAPIALLLIVFGKIIYLKRKRFLQKNELIRLLMVIIGLILGLFLLLGNGAIIGRSSTSYGEVYDYVSFSKVFSSPIQTMLRLLIHVAYNIRHLFIILIVVIGQIIISIRKKQKTILTAQVVCLSFSLLYIIGTSQILMLDDMESRLMSPAYLGLITSLLIPIYDSISHSTKKFLFSIKVANVVVLSLLVVAIADISYLRITQSNQYKETFSAIKESDKSIVCIEHHGDGDRINSVFYDFSSFPPFEEWTTDFGNVKIYNKTIQYSSKCN